MISSTSVQQISDITKNIVRLMKDISAGIKESGDTAQTQAAASEEILASLESMSSIAGSLKKMADKLVSIS
ncbi:MAG: hypothetical protein Q7J85_15105 [Bacillota bacterium]|nr:hypothetical protein [Bacillota bacterium]